MSSKTLLRFSAGNDLISLAIQQRTGCIWSHIDFLVGDRLLGALPGGGVQYRDRIHGEIRSVVYEVIGVENGHKYLESQIGKPYDYCAIAGLFLLFPRNWEDEKRWFCSEGIAASLMAAGCPITSVEAWGVTPRDIWISSLVKPISIE